jgi:hypothetical protein
MPVPLAVSQSDGSQWQVKVTVARGLAVQRTSNSVSGNTRAAVDHRVVNSVFM